MAEIAKITLKGESEAKNFIDEALRGDIAYEELSTTVSKAGGYVAGDHLIYLGQYYEVVADIAQGGTIVTSGAGQNVEEREVGDEIKKNKTQYDQVVAQIQTLESKIGDLTDLDTTVKTDLVSAVNEVDGNVDTLQDTKANQTVIATLQTNLVAVKKYEIGEQFIYNNTLYKADAVINQNGTITIGGNASLADDISTQISNLANSAKVKTVYGTIPNASSGEVYPQYPAGISYQTPVLALRIWDANSNVLVNPSWAEVRLYQTNAFIVFNGIPQSSQGSTYYLDFAVDP